MATGKLAQDFEAAGSTLATNGLLILPRVQAEMLAEPDAASEINLSERVVFEPILVPKRKGPGDLPPKSRGTRPKR